MRRLIGLLGVLAVLFLLGVTADRVAAGYVAGRLEEQLVTQGFRAPDVTIRGFPFLRQVVDKEYDLVEVSARSVQVPEGRAERVSARLEGVRVDDVVAPRAAEVRTLTARGTVPYSEVENAVDIPRLQLSQGGGGEVRVASELEVLGESFAVAARGRIDARGDHLRIVPTGLEVAGVGDLDDQLSAVISERIVIDYPIRGLPRGVAVQSIAGGPAGFIVEVRGRATRLQPQ